MTGLGRGLIEGDMSLLTHTLIMSLSKIPSVWVIIGITALFYGWLPRFAFILSWIVLAVFIIIEMFWEVGLVSWSKMKFTNIIQQPLIIQVIKTVVPVGSRYFYV